jgi:hypothetical protein
VGDLAFKGGTNVECVEHTRSPPLAGNDIPYPVPRKRAGYQPSLMMIAIYRATLVAKRVCSRLYAAHLPPVPDTSRTSGKHLRSRLETLPQNRDYDEVGVHRQLNNWYGSWRALRKRLASPLAWPCPYNDDYSLREVRRFVIGCGGLEPDEDPVVNPAVISM